MVPNSLPNQNMTNKIRPQMSHLAPYTLIHVMSYSIPGGVTVSDIVCSLFTRSFCLLFSVVSSQPILFSRAQSISPKNLIVRSSINRSNPCVSSDNLIVNSSLGENIEWLMDTK